MGLARGQTSPQRAVQALPGPLETHVLGDSSPLELQERTEGEWAPGLPS